MFAGLWAIFEGHLLFQSILLLAGSVRSESAGTSRRPRKISLCG